MIWALHGAVGMAADWRAFAAGLPSEIGGLRRLDLWRFLDCCPMSLEACGNALNEEILRVDPKPVLLGYSMGGRLALHALLAKPSAWKAAIIVSAHTGLSSESERAQRRKKDAEWSSLALKGEWLDFLEQWNAQSVLGDAGELPDRSELKSRRASVARSFVDWSLGTQAELLPELAKITCPVLWVTGERDEGFTQLGRDAVARLPNAEHRIISDCGHRIPWEKPEQFSRVCLDFLAMHLKHAI